MKVSGPIDRLDALRLYLQDHHAGAQAGLALARRAAGNQRGTTAGAVLAEIAREIEEDRQILVRVMRHVGARPSPTKAALAALGERLGRLKLNGQLLGDSPLSPVIELEALLSGIKSKEHVWILLRDATHVELPGVDPDRMIERVERQLDRLHELWRDAARAAFPSRTGSAA